jgi:hypothetical protein
MLVPQFTGECGQDNTGPTTPVARGGFQTNLAANAPPRVQDEYSVGVHDGGQAMGGDDTRHALSV